MVTPNPYRFELVRDSLLLVEGIDDLRFVNALLRRMGKSSIQLVAVGGIRRIRPFLTGILSMDPNFHRLGSLGIMRDADSSAESAFQSVVDALNAARLPAPPRPWTTVQEGQLSVSVAILPDGTSPGALEDLCLRSMAGQPVMDCVEQYMECLEGSGRALSQPGKSRIHAFLSGGDEPGLRIGEAADAGVWDWDSPAFGPIVRFLERL